LQDCTVGAVGAGALAELSQPAKPMQAKRPVAAIIVARICLSSLTAGDRKLPAPVPTWQAWVSRMLNRGGKAIQ
jgi:hypothetical protein